ncbi:MAG: hypothetical protein ACO3BD_00845 [Chitinophagaceae bacterium]
MEKEQNYQRDLAEIRSLMERSAKFLSLSGWAGVMAGIYALVGAYIAHQFLHFDPALHIKGDVSTPSLLVSLTATAVLVLTLTLTTGFVLSYRRAKKLGEPFWNTGMRRIIQLMGMPLVSGGLLLLLFLSQGSLHLLAPISLVFYGMAIYNAGHFSYRELQYLGITEAMLGIVAAFFPAYGLLLWAFGFGALHIVYGVYIHMKYQQ